MERSWEIKRRFLRNILDFFVMEWITLWLFSIGTKLEIRKRCRNRGYGGAGRPVDVRLAWTEAERRRNPHQDCRVSKRHEVSFELLRRILLCLSRIQDKFHGDVGGITPLYYGEDSPILSCGLIIFQNIWERAEWFAWRLFSYLHYNYKITIFYKLHNILKRETVLNH